MYVHVQLVRKKYDLFMHDRNGNYPTLVALPIQEPTQRSVHLQPGTYAQAWRCNTLHNIY
jgi:hypothetical protein